MIEISRSSTRGRAVARRCINQYPSLRVDEVIDDVAGVSDDSGQRLRPDGMKEIQPAEVEARLFWDHSSNVADVASSVEYWEIDPRETGSEPGTPDDVGNIEYPTVVQHRLAVIDSDDAPHPLGNCLEILRFHTHQRRRFGEKLRTNLPANGCGSVQNIHHHEPHQADHDIATEPGLDAERNVRRLLAGDVCLVGLGDFQSDVGT